MSNTKRLLLGLGVVTLTLGVGPCPGRVTGGGTVHGPSGHDTIAVNGDSCGSQVKGEFEYVAHNAEVKMHGGVTAVTQCVVIGVDANGNPITSCPQCQALVALLNPGQVFGLGAADFEVDVAYRSTNPAFAGNGQAFACVSDNGQGRKSTGEDVAFVQVLSGPFAGYTNFGSVQGNIKHHKCKTGTTF